MVYPTLIVTFAVTLTQAYDWLKISVIKLMYK